LIVNLLIGLSAVGILSYVISGSLSQLLVKFYLWLRHKTMWLIGVLLLFAVIWTGINEYSLPEYVGTLILGLTIAGIFWRTNFYILIFAFAISNHAVENLIRLKFLL
jgi:hypothetical protein